MMICVFWDVVCCQTVWRLSEKRGVEFLCNLYLVCIFAGSDPSAVSAGHRFMTDLLVSSLMADGGLETALKAAFKGDIITIYTVLLSAIPYF